MSQGTIKGFDGIRGLAVISVVLTHLGVFTSLTDKHILPASVIPMLSGSTGVQAFFVLSGFLITTLLINEFRTSGSISIKRFIVRRTLRIFPLYFLFAIAITLLHVCGRNVTSWGSLGYLYAYSYNFVPSNLYTSVLGHTWSLAVEEHFYLVWPVVFLLLFGKRRTSLIGLLVSFIAAAPLVHVALNRAGAATVYFIDRWTFIAGSSIAFGCLVAILIEGDQTAQRIRKIVQRRAFLVVSALLYTNSLYLTSNSWSIQNVGSSYLRLIGISFVIAWIFFNQGSRMVKFLELRPLKYVGVISYGVYMYQGFFLATGPYRDPNQSWPPSPEIGIVLLLVFAPLSYHYFEKPFLRLKSRFSAPNSSLSQ